MRLKNTAFIYNVTVGGTSNCDWGTDIGQSKKHTFTLEGFSEIVNAMVYYKIYDEGNIEVILGKGNRTPRKILSYDDTQLVLASCFKKVYLNGMKLVGQQFVMYILKETNELNSKGEVNVHKDRCTLKFSNSVVYRGECVNQKCIDAISNAFGQSRNGSWAILKMEIHNEDELHLIGFSLGDSPKNYSTVEERNEEFSQRIGEPNQLFSPREPKPVIDSAFLVPEEFDYLPALKTKPFMILGGFSGTGKSIEVKSLAFCTCLCDGVLNTSETSPGNYLLISVKPNWHDATEITGFRSSVQNRYYVTDFMRFLVKARMYEELKVPFFVCLDEMNLAPVEEYFADFLSVIESRKRKEDGRIVTDALVPASVFNEKYIADYNIFMDLGLKLTNDSWKADDVNALEKGEMAEAFARKDIVEDLCTEGLTIPQNVIIIGTVNMDDTTNTFSRKVIDRAMTFETVVRAFEDDYFEQDIMLSYVKNPWKGEYFISDEVRATEMLDSGRYTLDDADKKAVIGFINNINKDLEETPFKISHRILNETVLLYRAKKEIAKLAETDETLKDKSDVFDTDLNNVFDDILMQKILPRIEGDYEKCNACLTKLSARAAENNWCRSEDKIEFMIRRFGRDKSGFTSFWN